MILEGEKNLAGANEYLAFLDVGSTLVETRQEPSSRAHMDIRYELSPLRRRPKAVFQPQDCM